MASIRVKTNKDGSTTYHVCIRMKGQDLYKSFYNEEAAKLYAIYKENLINMIENFEVPLSHRLRLCDILDMKINEESITDKKTLNDYKITLDRISMIIGHDTFIYDTTYDEWLECAKKLFSAPVYRGGKTEVGKRDMSPITLRRIFAYASAAISFVRKKGIEIENYPLKIIQDFINPKIKT